MAVSFNVIMELLYVKHNYVQLTLLNFDEVTAVLNFMCTA